MSAHGLFDVKLREPLNLFVFVSFLSLQQSRVPDPELGSFSVRSWCWSLSSLDASQTSECSDPAYSITKWPCSCRKQPQCIGRSGNWQSQRGASDDEPTLLQDNKQQLPSTFYGCYSAMNTRISQKELCRQFRACLRTHYFLSLKPIPLRKRVDVQSQRLFKFSLSLVQGLRIESLFFRCCLELYIFYIF
jgi:hypothetical protein